VLVFPSLSTCHPQRSITSTRTITRTIEEGQAGSPGSDGASPYATFAGASFIPGITNASDGQFKIGAMPVTLKPWRSDVFKRYRLESSNRNYELVLES
jgi:hypothetical protein